MNTGMLKYTLLMLMPLLTTACARNVPLLDNPLTINADEYEHFFHAGVEVLRRRGFQIDRQDYRFGVITTNPETSPTVLEPWCDHNSTPQQMWLSTLNHMQRRVTIMLEPVLQNDNDAIQDATADTGQSTFDQFRFRVEVLLERLEQPALRMTNASHGAGFSRLKEIPHELEIRGIEPRYWQPVGRDPYLEYRLVSEIKQYAVTH